ncbi:aminotransferase class V-fold PLP-dependent enzyme [Holophaga foetida]|uniref:aminotransferase class V-fold PLP-dependent enzyme n=1 Tax=Holophaga foetida TaxID=35839 RepID=UPI00024725C9|nr:aminotransferase class V-fold PLP-dependent enzyme [Holophaga foetida]
MNQAPLNPGLFRLDPDHLWVQHCSDGPIPMASVQAVQAHLERELKPWEMDFQRDGLDLPAAVRREAAQVIGGRASDISLTQNTSSGLVTVAQSLSLNAGDEVLAPLGEFPSNAWPWKALENRGVVFREVALWEGHAAGENAWSSAAPQVADDPEGRILAALGPRTRVLALSWVRFQDGVKLDLGRLGAGCRARGTFLVVDGIQGAGCAMPDLSQVDAFATGGHKGLLAPQGLGFLWTASAFRACLAPTGSWLSVEQGSDFRRASTDFDRAWLSDGRRMEPGTPNILACAALAESLKTLNSAGVGVIQSHIVGLQARLLDRVVRGPWASESRRLRGLLESGRLGPILSFHHQGWGVEKLLKLLAHAMERGIFPSVREGYLRIAFHGWHTGEDVDRIADWLETVS